ncbi:MAG: glutamate--cysteine ligase, partial [Brevundimonas sp.]
MTEAAPLTRQALIEAMSRGAKPRDQWRIGAEHEKFGFDKTTLARPAYEGPNGIRAMLEGLERFGWSRVEENGVLIGLERRNAEGFIASVSLEPGGQFELSGAPLLTIHDICNETGQHLMEVKQVADQIGVGFLGAGFDPLWRRADIPVMPKGRYDIMRAYMPKVGTLGLDMMLR